MMPVAVDVPEAIVDDWDDFSVEFEVVAMPCPLEVLKVSVQLSVELGTKLCVVDDDVEDKVEATMLLWAELGSVAIPWTVSEVERGVGVSLQLSVELGRVAMPCAEDELEKLAGP